MSLTQFADLHMPKLRPGLYFKWPAWTPADGPAFGIYDRMPPGSRFLGSYNLSTSSGVLRPRDIGLGTDDLGVAQMVACLEDWLAQGRCWNQVSDMYDLVAQQKRSGAAVTAAARAVHHAMSDGNLEVVCDWMPPGKIWADIRARGWDSLTAVV